MALVRNRGYRGGSVAAYGAARTLGRAARPALKRLLSRRPAAKAAKRAKRKESSGDGDVMTNQFDTRLVYKRSSKSSRRHKKSFARKVQNAMATTYLDNNFVTTNCETTSSTGGQQHCSGYLMMESFYGNGNVSTGDLYAINYEMSNLGPAGVSSYSDPKKFMVRQCTLDLQIQNTSASIYGTTVIVDVYSIFCKKDISDATYVSQFMTNCALAGGVSNQATQTKAQGGDTLVGSLTVGATPFQFSKFCRAWTVGEKRRFLLTQGQIATMQMKGYYKKKGFVSAQDVGLNNQVWAKKGWTRGYLIIYWCLGNNSLNTNVTAYPPASLTITTQKTFLYKTANPINIQNWADTSKVQQQFAVLS